MQTETEACYCNAAESLSNERFLNGRQLSWRSSETAVGRMKIRQDAVARQLRAVICGLLGVTHRTITGWTPLMSDRTDIVWLHSCMQKNGCVAG